MGDRTIPEPSKDIQDAMLHAVRSQAMSIGNLDPSEPNVAKFIEHQAAVVAQLNAEVLWLRNILHIPNRIEK